MFDLGIEDMFIVENNKFVYFFGQFVKFFNLKSFNVFFVVGGLVGLEKGLQINCEGGLSVDEILVGLFVVFEEVVFKGVLKYGFYGDIEFIVKGDNLVVVVVVVNVIILIYDVGGVFVDCKCIFKENRLLEKKSKLLLQFVWIIYNDKILILLMVVVVVLFVFGLYQIFGVIYELELVVLGQFFVEEGVKVEWVEGVVIMVVIIIVVVVGMLNDW